MDTRRRFDIHGGMVAALAPQFALLQPDTVAPLPSGPLEALGEKMEAEVDDVSDLPDAEENPFCPAGYTYLGQFVDHDLTFDTQSSFNTGASTPGNNRTPRLDMDCVYGSGPDDHPYMYRDDHASLIDPMTGDLPRASPSPDSGEIPRAVIGDPRNDENSIVCQLQLAWIKFHNKVVESFAADGLRETALFIAARNEVRWTYQSVIMDDFLRRIVDSDVYDEFLAARAGDPKSAYRLFKPPLQIIPVEFAAAAWRWGHSAVRNGYRLNQALPKPLKVFNPEGDVSSSLVGFGPLPKSHRIEWRLFYPDAANEASGGDVPPPGELSRNKVEGKTRLQFAYKIDTQLVNPLKSLPASIATHPSSLATRNLLRGNLFRLASGQAFATKLGVPAVQPDHLTVRIKDDVRFQITDIDPSFGTATPLWFYILSEAETRVKDAEDQNGGQLDEDVRAQIGAQLGRVGGRIVLEVLYGLLDTDGESVVHQTGWKPRLIQKLRMSEILKVAGVF